MHSKSRPGIHLANSTPCVAIGFRDIRSKKIDASDIEAKAADRTNRHVPVIRMDNVGYIDCRPACRKISGTAQVDDLACLRHAVFGVPVQGQNLFRLVVELESR